MTRQTHLTLRLALAEANKIQAEAAAAGMSVSAYVRAALLERSRLDAALTPLQAELAENRAGAAELETIAVALSKLIDRDYFIRVAQHLDTKLNAIISHHKIQMPLEL